MFKKLKGDQVLLHSGGVFKVCDIYTRDGGLWAAWSGGYIRLKTDGTTSKDKVSISALETELPLYKGLFGRIKLSGEEPFHFKQETD